MLLGGSANENIFKLPLFREILPFQRSAAFNFMIMKTIELTQGKIALINDEDFEWLNQFKWYAHKDRNTFYAVRNLPRVNGKQTTQPMHKFIMGDNPLELDIDHRDGDGCNNQK